MRNKENW